MIPVIILARGGTKGIPGKSTMDFHGKPLIAWSIIQSHNDGFKNVYVSTDSKEIADASREYGAKVIKRPKELATDEVPSDLALLHAVRKIKGDFNTVINLQCTSPIRQDGDITDAYLKFWLNGYDSLFSCSIMPDPCIWNSKKSITYDWRNRQRRQDKKEFYLENGSIYIFRREVLEETNNRLGGDIGRYYMAPWQSFELDEPGDIEIVKYFMKRVVC